MSFDIDPQDRTERFLLFHPESDSLFEVKTRAEYDQCMFHSDGMVQDVTDIAEFEQKFKTLKK